MNIINRILVDVHRRILSLENCFEVKWKDMDAKKSLFFRSYKMKRKRDDDLEDKLLKKRKKEQYHDLINLENEQVALISLTWVKRLPHPNPSQQLISKVCILLSSKNEELASSALEFFQQLLPVYLEGCLSEKLVLPPIFPLFDHPNPSVINSLLQTIPFQSHDELSETVRDKLISLLDHKDESVVLNSLTCLDAFEEDGLDLSYQSLFEKLASLLSRDNPKLQEKCLSVVRENFTETEAVAFPAYKLVSEFCNNPLLSDQSFKLLQLRSRYPPIPDPGLDLLSILEKSLNSKDEVVLTSACGFIRTSDIEISKKVFGQVFQLVVHKDYSVAIASFECLAEKYEKIDEEMKSNLFEMIFDKDEERAKIAIYYLDLVESKQGNNGENQKKIFDLLLRKSEDKFCIKRCLECLSLFNLEKDTKFEDFQIDIVSNVLLKNDGEILIQAASCIYRDRSLEKQTLAELYEILMIKDQDPLVIERILTIFCCESNLSPLKQQLSKKPFLNWLGHTNDLIAFRTACIAGNLVQSEEIALGDQDIKRVVNLASRKIEKKSETPSQPQASAQEWETHRFLLNVWDCLHSVLEKNETKAQLICQNLQFDPKRVYDANEAERFFSFLLALFTASKQYQSHLNNPSFIQNFTLNIFQLKRKAQVLETIIANCPILWTSLLSHPPFIQKMLGKDHRQKLSTIVSKIQLDRQFLSSLECFAVSSSSPQHWKSLALLKPIQVISIRKRIIEAMKIQDENNQLDQNRVLDFLDAYSGTYHHGLNFSRVPKFPREIKHESTKIYSDLFQYSHIYGTTFEIEGKRISCHQIVLMVASKYFQLFFTTSMKEKDEQVHHLTDIDFDMFQSIVLFCYHKKITFNSLDDVIQILYLANRFQIEELEELCVDLLVYQVNPDSFVQLYECGEFNFPDLQLACVRWLSKTNLNMEKLSSRKQRLKKYISKNWEKIGTLMLEIENE